VPPRSSNQPALKGGEYAPLVAETGTWLATRQVLISPHALVAIFNEAKKIDVALTRKQIEASPSLETDQPVSRQFETYYYQYYGWPVYWTGPDAWGCHSYLERDRGQWRTSTPAHGAWDPHLRSIHAVIGNYLHAIDGEIGHVDDFIMDDDTWTIRYLIVNTSNWWPGKKVLVSPQWIDHVGWNDKTVFVNCSRAAVQQAPEYTDTLLLTRDYELGLHGHYNRQGYWVDELVNSQPLGSISASTGSARGWSQPPVISALREGLESGR
jgi:hypothetical protein